MRLSMVEGAMSPIGHLLVVGTNFRTASPRIRERLLLQESSGVELMHEMKTLGIDEGMVISTCERLDLIAFPATGMVYYRPLQSLLGRRLELDEPEVAAECYFLEGDDAARHLFAVSSSLDSHVVGEPHILGQVKEAHRLAAGLGMTGANLEALLRACYTAAKRIRSETQLAQQAVSIAASALQVTRSIHGELADCNVLLLGLSGMGEMLAAEFREAGVTTMMVGHDSEARAREVSRRLHAHFRTRDDLREALTASDIVICDSGSAKWRMSRDLVVEVLKQRRRKPIFFIDLGLPSDVDPAVEGLEDAFVYDLEDLEGVARRGRANREAATVSAWRILGEELARYRREKTSRSSAATVTALRRRFEDMRAEVLAQSNGDADAATRMLIKRLLHDPCEALRDVALEGDASREVFEASVRRLFKLEEDIGEGEQRPSDGKSHR